MSSIVLSGNTSGAITLDVPAVAGTNTVTIPASTGTAMVTGNMPTFRAINNATQTLSLSTLTLVNLQTENWDTASAFNNTASTVTLNGISTPAYAFAPPVAGYYQVSCSVSAGGSSGQLRILASLYKNGSPFEYGTNLTGTIAYSTSNSYLVYLNGTSDYIQMYAYIQSSSTAILDNAGCSFSATLVRGA